MDVQDSRRKTSEREFHDRYFGGEHARAGRSGFYTDFVSATLLNSALSKLGDLKGKRILYYGCGVNSSIPRAFAAAGATVVAIDLSRVAVRFVSDAIRAEGYGGRAHAAQMDAEVLAFRDQSFDLIFGRAILYHLNVRVSALELARVLVPGGRAVFIEPLGKNPLINLYRRLTPKIRTPDEHPFLEKDLRELSSHFRIMRQEPFFLLTLASFLFSTVLKSAPLYDLSFKVLSRGDSLLLRSIPPLRQYCWATVLTLDR